MESRKPTKTVLIQQTVRERIEDGTYPEATQISRWDLAREFSVTTVAVGHAIGPLIVEGLLITGRSGRFKGTWVKRFPTWEEHNKPNRNTWTSRIPEG